MTSCSASPRLGILIKALGVVSLITLSVALCVFGQDAPPQAATQNPAPTAAQTPANAQAKAEEGLPPQAKSPIEKAIEDGSALKLSMKDITKLALQNNLDIAISDTQEQLLNQKLIGTYGAYDGQFSIQTSVGSGKSPNTRKDNQGIGLPYSTSDSASWNVRFNQNIPTGGSIQASWNTGRTDTNQEFDLFNPQYTARSSVNFTQPLWQNFKIDQYRNSIKLANLDLKSNDVTFRQNVTNTIASIQSQYWDLVSAIRDYEIQRESVKLAQMSLRDNQKKVDVGTLAPITVVQSKADLANRELQLITSEETILRQENGLRQLISNDRNSEIWKKVIVPTDTPDFKEYKVSLDVAIDAALANRPELAQYAITLEQSDMNYRLSQNSKKWQVNLIGSFSTYGVAGPKNEKVAEEFVGGLLNSYKVALIGGYTTWSAGVNLVIPLRNRSVESSLAQNRIQQKQTLMNRLKTEQQIQVEIRNAVQNLETMRRSVDTSRVGRELAEQQLDGEQKRFEAGLSEAYRVLDQQSKLTSAQGQELRSLINYRKAIITLQKAMYTLLEANDFEVAKSSSDNIPKFK